MSYLDRDILKLKKFAKRLGLKIYTRPYSKHKGAADYTVNSHINLFVSKSTTKTEIILSLLHELGHHLDWLNVKKVSKDEDIAFETLVSGSMFGKRPDINKKYRKIIYQVEKSGIKYMDKIHKALNLEIPLYKVKHQQEIDLFDYKILYKKGRFATHHEIRQTVYKKIHYYRKKYGKRKKQYL